MPPRHPAVSICIPTYNGARYLPACLDSVLSQSFHDFELLVVDDASSDATIDIVRKYQTLDARIRLVRNPSNIGLVANWNRCVAFAGAPWVKFVFQDDLLAPQCVARMMSLTSRGCPLISCARDFIFGPGTSDESKAHYLNNRQLIESIHGVRGELPAREFCNAVLENPVVNLVGEPTAVLVRADVFERFGSFDARLVTYCDAEYWLRIICHTGTIHIPDALATFRVHSEATSANNVANRAFRASIIDKLIIRHEMAFADTYAPLREAAASRRPPVDLIELFWEELHWVTWGAQRAANDASARDPVPLRELTDLAYQLPRMGAIPVKYRALRIWRSIERRANRVFGDSARARSSQTDG